MMKILIPILQLLIFLLFSPLLSGLIAKVKNNLRMRRGQSIFQPYFNLAKLFSKGEVVSETSSWIFKSAPFIVLASSLATAVIIPLLIFPSPAGHIGDFLALIFIFALGRFFIALAALDTGSSFGGMGSSREMFISSLAEPALLLAAFALFLQSGSTDVSILTAFRPLSVSSVVAALCLFLIMLAETSRIPVDNQETHLELTMIHEAMVLEYSGRFLAVLEMAVYVKQMTWICLVALVIFPIVLPQGILGFIFWSFLFLSRIVIIALAVSFVEVAVAKMRLFRAVDFLGFAFVLGAIAGVCAILGV